MQSQQQANRIRIRPTNPNYDDYKHGTWGEPVIWRRENHPLPRHWTYNAEIGKLYVGRPINSERDYYYICTEYKDGWWKLEWPD